MNENGTLDWSETPCEFDKVNWCLTLVWYTINDYCSVLYQLLMFVPWIRDYYISSRKLMHVYMALKNPICKIYKVRVDGCLTKQFHVLFIFNSSAVTLASSAEQRKLHYIFIGGNPSNGLDYNYSLGKHRNSLHITYDLLKANLFLFLLCKMNYKKSLK